jgi:hypothetical protein
VAEPDIRRRVEGILGCPLPDDFGETSRLLQRSIREQQTRRLAAERRVEQIPGYFTGIEQVEFQLLLRTSPELERLRERTESLLHRLRIAREKADHIADNVERARRYFTNRLVEQPPEDEGPDAGIDAKTERLVSALAHYNQLRLKTDRIGRDDAEG